MAKLTGVKIIDMEDGSVKKVEHKGEEYVRVDEKAQVGDIVRSKGTLDAKEGNFYEVVEDALAFPSIYDDVDDHRYMGRNMSENFAVFRKDSHSFVAGDKVTLLDGGGEFPLLGFKNGETYTVTNTEYFHVTYSPRNCLRIENESGNSGFALPEQLEKVTKSLHPGDYAVILEGADAGLFDNGDVVLITDEVSENFDYFAVKVGEDGSREAFDASELRKATDTEVAKAKGDHTSELSVGDYARVDSNGWRLADLSLSEGDLVRIRDTGIIHDFIVDRVSDGKSEAFFALDLKKVDAPEITFEPGDLVRITKDQSGKPVGTIVEVTDVHPDLIWYPSSAPIGYVASKDAVELVCRKADRKDTVTVG